MAQTSHTVHHAGGLSSSSCWNSKKESLGGQRSCWLMPCFLLGRLRCSMWTIITTMVRTRKRVRSCPATGLRHVLPTPGTQKFRYQGQQNVSDEVGLVSLGHDCQMSFTPETISVAATRTRRRQRDACWGIQTCGGGDSTSACIVLCQKRLCRCVGVPIPVGARSFVFFGGLFWGA